MVSPDGSVAQARRIQDYAGGGWEATRERRRTERRIEEKEGEWKGKRK